MKYVAIYRVPVATMQEWMANTSEEERKKQGEELGKNMMAWNEKHKAHFVGEGLPLGKTKTVAKDGIKDSRNDLNYMQVIEADSHEAAAAIFADSPHMMIPDSSIDIMEVPHMRM